MTSLLLVLTPIALLDSASITPLCIVPLIALMSGRSPLLRVVGFLSGIFVTYLIAGIAVLFGLGAVIELLNRHLDRFIYDPGTLDIVLQIIVGATMLAFGWAMASAREDHGDRGLGLGDVSPGQAFTGAAVLTLVGMPGAFPYFAAVDQMLRAEVGTSGLLAAVLYYNVLFILPLVAIVALRLALGDAGEAVVSSLQTFLSRWGRRAIIVILLLLGAVLVADGVGWLAGAPLLPTPSRPLPGA